MSRKHTAEELEEIGESLVINLRECEDGTNFTTYRLLKYVGYDLDEFEHMDFFRIHSSMIKAAKENDIRLDFSAHKGKEEGLPFALDFIVRNKKAQIKCPFCGSRRTARILYGLPAFDNNLIKLLEEKKVSLGGCVIGLNDPKKICIECGKRFGTDPLNIDRSDNFSEDYRDIAVSIEFSVHNYFKGYSDVSIRKNEKGAFVKTSGFSPDNGTTNIEKQITEKRWNKIVNKLYGRMYLHEWKKNYKNPDICVSDGTNWSLKIKLSGKRERNYHGSNCFPPYWTELTKIFRPFLKQ